MNRRRTAAKKIAFQDEEITYEANLPYPYAHYPGHYGAFFGFSKSKESKVYFCSCSILAIENYMRLRTIFDDSINSNPLKNFILSVAHFPLRPISQLYNDQMEDGMEIIKKISFKEDICHECQRQTPELSYCHKMYGGVFEQNFGWYINKQSFEYGVRPVSYRILEDVCPDEIYSLLDIGKKKFLSLYNQYSENDIAIHGINQDSEFRIHTRKIRTIIENEVRVKFGFKKVGDAWVQETLLYQLVSEIFPDKKTYRHYRPHFLNNLELDIYIPHLKVGIEYQGIQHFEVIDHWGGEEALKQLKKRDREKLRLCKQNKIKLIYFYYDEDLTKSLVMNRILEKRNND